MTAIEAQAPLFREHERYLWGLCYRLTGSAADADDLVQETFLRAMERPPANTAEPWRPWLTRVAVNLGRDALRRRKRRAYVGPWLPSPIETEEEPPSFEVEGDGGPFGRYDLIESASFAFLLALEALSPRQRAVLLLRDVYDYSVEETAKALGLTEANVKTTHHRARRALEPYQTARCPPSPALVARGTEALHRFLATIATGDVAAVEALLAEGVLSLSDGGGEYLASRTPIAGAARVAKMYVGLYKHGSPATRFTIRTLNGLPALVVEREELRQGEAPRYVFQCAIDGAGRITAIYSVLAPGKLSALAPITSAG